MAKSKIGPETLLLPLPVALVTVQLREERPNIITVSWVGICCSEPPMLGVGIRESRYSHQLVSEAGEFVVNIPSDKHIRAADMCGIISGRSKDKFRETGFTAVPAEKVSAPLIAECPINMECIVRHTLKLGSHDYFVAEIVQTHVDEECLSRDGRLDITKAAPVAYMTRRRAYFGGYTKIFGEYGFSSQA